MTTALEPIHDYPGCERKRFTAKVGEPINPDADEDVVCFMTTTSVDADDEVMLPGGIDLSRYLKNPVVLLMHSMGQPGTYPLPIGKALWTKPAKNGVMAGVRFSRDTEMGRQVKALFDEGMMNAFSVGFRPLEASGMTRKEAESRSDWAEAFERTKGHIRVHRKWLMVELSVVGVPSNPDALVVSYKAKGILVPKWLNLEPKATTMDDEPEEVEDKAETPCECGKADCAKCSPKDPVETKAGDEEMPAEGEAPDPDDFDEEDETELPIKTGDHVDVKCKGLHGCGRVEKIHRRGMVEHVDEDMIGTKDDPAARVRLYRAHGDGHKPSETRIAAKLKNLSRRAEPFKEPSKKSVEAASEVETKSATSGPLPPLACLSDTEIAQKALAQINDIPALVQREIARITGVV